MKKVLTKRTARITGAASALGVLAVFAVAGVAGAATGSQLVTSGFSSATTQLTTYLGLGIGLVLAIFIASIGVRMFQKWSKRAATSG